VHGGRETDCLLADIPAASSKLADGWWIPHPGTLQWQKCESFEQAMDKWFEGFNLPRLVENGHMEDIEAANARVRRFYDGSRNILANKEESLIQQLDRAIRASHMNRMDLAVELDVQPSQISKWMSSSANPTLDSLEKMARILGKKLVLVDL
jgi:DNA-binding phage protein